MAQNFKEDLCNALEKFHESVMKSCGNAITRGFSWEEDAKALNKLIGDILDADSEYGKFLVNYPIE